MSFVHYVGLDVHKKSVAFCVKLVDGSVIDRGSVKATRATLLAWEQSLPKPWIGAMEATLFTDWIYDLLKPHAYELKVAHPAKLLAISASKKKNDRQDAEMIADLLRCNLIPEVYVAPPQMRELRNLLRYRTLVVTMAV